MNLRTRIVLSLLAITVVLAAPAAYGLVKLGSLQRIANHLQTGNAEASLALGRLQTTLARLESAQAALVGVTPAPALGTTQADIARVRETRSQIREETLKASAELRRLQRSDLARAPDGQYAAATALAARRWRDLQQAVRKQQDLLAAGQVNQADTVGTRELVPAFQAMDDALTPIGRAIDISGRERVEEAGDAARIGRIGTITALVAALVLTLVIGAALTRSLLRPIGELRRGMAVVAEGDFKPGTHIPRERPDELGDLARSFDTMTTQLAELDRLKAEFVSVASHEIKTPLSVIRGYVSLLLDGIYGEITDTQRKTLASVNEQTERLNRLVHRLLDVTRFEAGGGRLELREIPLRGFLADLAEGFEVLAFQNQIDFHADLSQRLPEFIVGDPERLNEVLGNLLSNAFKFTPRGGRIDVRAAPHGDGIAVEVEDTGVGIPSDKLPKIFEKFFQVENVAQPRSVGSGLGLAIAREIVGAHGGTITAESEPGRGTCFRVTLPARPPAHAAAGHA